ncbi:SAM-dependent methyltransferase [Paenibacillus sp. GCM10027627]|uniref:SAM-dependent methyltransferase n=1 Tax=unclassified Paenibacillus TaxID=185978 RepID=UPI0036313104
MTQQSKKRYLFNEAPFWEWQRSYYEEKGKNAWTNDQVPQYSSSNPMMATAYAEMIFGFLQDRAKSEWPKERVVIAELGAGHGRLAFHLLDRLCELIDYAGLELPPFQYILTDLAEANIDAWREHHALKRFVDSGLLDFAKFDAMQDAELHLLVSKETISPGSLKQPVVIVANYFFDAIPQQLIYIKEGRVLECEVMLELEEGEGTSDESGALKHVPLSYSYREAPHYEDDSSPYREVISLYREELEDSHVLFPAAGLACIERLHALSEAGFVLLTADKGDHLLESWKYAEPPQLVVHGSFSLTANYHALLHVWEQRGALPLLTAHHYQNINVGCLIMVDNPPHCTQLRLAYRRFVERFGPDDFYSLKEWADRSIHSMKLKQLLAFWRLGGYDAEFFVQSAKRLSSLILKANDEELDDIVQGIRLMWKSYYKLEQRYDLALDAGLLLFEMERYEDAKIFLEKSVETDEEEPLPTVWCCLAVCCCEMGMIEQAKQYLQAALAQEPDHLEAQALLESLSQ